MNPMRSKRFNFLLEPIAILACVLGVIPIVLMVLTSFKPDGEIVRFDSVLPQSPTLENYRQIFGNSEEVPILRWLRNSFFISTSITLLVLTVSSMAAYSLARIRPPGSKWLFAIIVGTMMVPGQILLVPLYMLLNKLGWIDTPLALIIPHGAGAFGVFMLYSFLKGIPRELEEAAAIDGCSLWGIYWHVVLPLAKPVLATLAIFVFLGSWNDFLGPLVFTDSSDMYTLPVGVAMFQSSYANEYGLTFAACVICTLPVLAVFIIFSRQIIAGMTAGALKE
jgi:multiple sugar transport system permease protein